MASTSNSLNNAMRLFRNQQKILTNNAAAAVLEIDPTIMDK